MDALKLNKILTYFIFYVILVIIYLGMFGEHLDADLVHFVYLYAIPILIIIVLSIATAVYEIRGYLKSKETNAKLLIITFIKLNIATLPIYDPASLIPIFAFLRLQ